MTFPDRHPIRILHVVGGMDRGGIETWLMNVLRHIDRDRFQMDFAVHTTQPCAYDDEVRSFGSKVIPCLNPSQPLLYARNFKRILREHGPYDIVHSHVHHYSGYVLRLARQAGVPVRIAHSHTDTSLIEAKAGLYRRLYLTLMQSWLARHATCGLGCSHNSALDLFGSAWDKDSRWRIFHCGINLDSFHKLVNPKAVRAEFGIPEDAFAIGHVGRFEYYKNHIFLLEIAAEVAKRDPKLYVLLLGDGSLRSEIEQKAMQLGLGDRVIFAGSRPDVPQIMLGAMDVLLFPSLYEGLGLALVEAQAAGLPCIFSDVVPQEADLVKPLVHRMSLTQPVSAWADMVMAIKQGKNHVNRSAALATVEKSPFDLQTGVRELEFYYTQQLSY